MATIELDASELGYLSLLVKWRLSWLAMELDHTDSRDYKAMLRKQRDELERLQQKLGGAA